MSAVEITIFFFGAMLACLAMGVPISIALGGISAILVYFFWGPNALSMMVLKSFNTTSSFEYVAIPLFIYMANMLERSGIAEDLYLTMNRLVGQRPGGLAAGTIMICTIFAAMAGISGAATVAMGIIALPAMLSRGYSKQLALGSIAAGGSLGILIPPSVTMIIYGLISNTSVGRLYAAGLLPGLLLAALFTAYVLIRGYKQPHLAPPAIDDGKFTLAEKIRSLKGLIFPFLLVGAVLGAILSGLTSISEAAAVGALGSIVACLMKRGLRLDLFQDAAVTTLLLSCLIFWIIIGAGAFSTLYTAMGASSLIRDAVLGLEVNRYVVLLIMMLILILLGMVIDTVGVIMITVPVFLPIVRALGFDPVWFGILFIINMEIGFLTPPFGYNLFYLKGVAPPGVVMGDIYRSIVPFVALMLLGLGLCIAFPGIVLVLPNWLFS
jgi:tripartite ATP-independent transporter DctM subunit